MKEQKNLTGKPSIDRPWMKYYPDQLMSMISLPHCTVREYLERHCPGPDVAAIHYYGENITWKTIFEQADTTASALKAIGFGQGDQIPVFLRLVPEFLSLLLAAERIGASLLCRDNTLKENVEAVQKSGARIIFAQSFLSQEELNSYLTESQVEKVILIDPFYHGKKNSIPDHVKSCLDSCYPSVCAHGPSTLSWEEFLALGNEKTNQIDTPVSCTRPLLRAYTSGSTGPSKQVIHSADTMLGIICQMNFYGNDDNFRPNWLVTCLPPSLIAVVVSMVLLPLASNRLLILDPFCFPQDVDLEIMRYKPNNWPIIPMFFEIIMRSKRIPEDYDMSHLIAAGAGCEALNNNQLKRAQDFLIKHNCHFRFTTGYGSSEAGSNFSLPMCPKPLGNGNVGVPLPLSIVSIFKPGTTQELTYYELGEICKTGPGNMIGYDNPEATKKALQLHDDEKVWLHTGDLGYMDEDGVIYVLNRNETFRYGGGSLAILQMENLLADARIKGIDDEFFVLCEDEAHPGYFLPFLYVVLNPGYTVDDIRCAVLSCLEPHMHPEEIIAIEERPFFHFKTNRIGLVRQLKDTTCKKNPKKKE